MKNHVRGYCLCSNASKPHAVCHFSRENFRKKSKTQKVKKVKKCSTFGIFRFFRLFDFSSRNPLECELFDFSTFRGRKSWFSRCDRYQPEEHTAEIDPYPNWTLSTNHWIPPTSSPMVPVPLPAPVQQLVPSVLLSRDSDLARAIAHAGDAWWWHKNAPRSGPSQIWDGFSQLCFIHVYSIFLTKNKEVINQVIFIHPKFSKSNLPNI